MLSLFDPHMSHFLLHPSSVNTALSYVSPTDHRAHLNKSGNILNFNSW